ncbi:hypothetical protein AMEX_G558 [Astyanax mexicanus]|uniref:Uncharacterized protein n=1 Tax=Astyanax mexicanus TaxID=7994 RepID=A0A8T2MFM0_ASTMX|nr:hypothetical protein AMEX_G558 [Astyanax mexicanus]
MLFILKTMLVLQPRLTSGYSGPSQKNRIYLKSYFISVIQLTFISPAPPPTPPKTVKVFSFVTGNTLGSHKQFVGTLCSRRAGIQEVSTVEECDVILCFCPVVSKAGINIEAALQKLNDFPVTKDVVLVVLHHTFDPKCTVPDSSRSVSRENTLTVDCLFHEDRGILHCSQNEEAFRTVLKLIDTKVSNCFHFTADLDPCTTVKLFTQPLQKYLIIRPGRTLRCHESIMQSLQKQRPELQEVFTVIECDVVLAFCCIDPQGGSDIQETMNFLDNLPDSKPVALVVLHQTSDPEHVVPDRSGLFTREIMLDVDFLFHENEELLPCPKNESSMNKVLHWLISEVRCDSWLHQVTYKEN